MRGYKHRGAEHAYYIHTRAGACTWASMGRAGKSNTALRNCAEQGGTERAGTRPHATAACTRLTAKRLSFFRFIKPLFFSKIQDCEVGASLPYNRLSMTPAPRGVVSRDDTGFGF